jgi:hypothetical protein
MAGRPEGPAPEGRGGGTTGAGGGRLEVERIRDQLRRAVHGDAWHGPALLELLMGVPPEAAAERPLPDRHSIWEILLHLEAWANTVARRLDGEAVELSPSEDWPDAPRPSETAWTDAVERFGSATWRLDAALSRLSDQDLLRPAPGRDHPVYVLVHGSIQHLLYHAGQIALLRAPRRGAGGAR